VDLAVSYPLAFNSRTLSAKELILLEFNCLLLALYTVHQASKVGLLALKTSEEGALKHCKLL